MNSKVTFVLGMLVGALAGSGASYYILEKRYEERIKTEVDSVKDTFDKELHKIAERNSAEEKNKVANKYRDVTDNLGYSHDDGFRMPSDVPVEEPADIPVQESLIDQEKPGDTYEIPEEEYGGDGEYRTVDLTYYSDGILTDDQDEPVDDIQETIGNHVMDVLDEKIQAGFEDIYIRNAVRGTDYRISLIDETSE